MANSYAQGDAGTYPQKHNKRELKTIETAQAYTPTTAANWTTQPGAPSAPDDVNQALDTLAASAASAGVSSLAALADDYAITATDGYSVFIVNDAITITLPDASDNIGRRIQFIQLGTAVLTVAQNADDANIAGADADYVSMDAAGDRAELISTGVEWLVLHSTIA